MRWVRVRWAHAPALAREGDDEVVAALPAPRPAKAMRQDSAFQVTAELALHMGRHRPVVVVKGRFFGATPLSGSPGHFCDPAHPVCVMSMITPFRSAHFTSEPPLCRVLVPDNNPSRRQAIRLMIPIKSDDAAIGAEITRIKQLARSAPRNVWRGWRPRPGAAARPRWR
jgi:hypothetical protein